jgi:hypothetical protein
MGAEAINHSQDNHSAESLLSSLLRLITPEEIQELTTISQGEERNSLTDMLRSSIGLNLEGPNNVLELVDTEVIEDVEAYTKPDFNSENKGVVFILEIKDKMRKSREGLKSKEVYDLYHRSSLVDIEQEKSNKDDLKKNSYLGVLVNKRQA